MANLLFPVDSNASHLSFGNEKLSLNGATSFWVVDDDKNYEVVVRYQTDNDVATHLHLYPSDEEKTKSLANSLFKQGLKANFAKPISIRIYNSVTTPLAKGDSS